MIDYSCDVRRHACITVAGLDREGKPVQIEAQDLLAVVLQHEIDHLDGTLFIDRISRLKRSLYNRQLREKSEKMTRPLRLIFMGTPALQPRALRPFWITVFNWRPWLPSRIAPGDAGSGWHFRQ